MNIPLGLWAENQNDQCLLSYVNRERSILLKIGKKYGTVVITNESVFFFCELVFFLRATFKNPNLESVDELEKDMPYLIKVSLKLLKKMKNLQKIRLVTC